METKTLTIMFVDLVGSTKRSSLTSRESYANSLKTYRFLVEPCFEKASGHLIDKIGDGLMAAFESPTNAVLCGVDIQNTILNHNNKVGKNDMIHVRVALNTGEVQVTGNEIFGNAVNIASKIEKLTKPDRIFFTESVFQSMNKSEVAIGFVGSKKIKGLPYKIRIYAVLGRYDQIMRKVKKMRIIRRQRIIAIITTLITLAVIFGAAAAAYFFFLKNLI